MYEQELNIWNGIISLNVIMILCTIIIYTVPYLLTVIYTIVYIHKVIYTMPYVHTVTYTVPYVHTVIYTVPYVHTVIPYSGFISRVENFANCTNCNPEENLAN